VTSWQPSNKKSQQKVKSPATPPPLKEKVGKKGERERLSCKGSALVVYTALADVLIPVMISVEEAKTAAIVHKIVSLLCGKPEVLNLILNVALIPSDVGYFLGGSTSRQRAQDNGVSSRRREATIENFL